MNKTLLVTALVSSIGIAYAAPETMTSATFTMYDGTGGLVPTGTGGPDNTVTGTIDSTANTWSVASTTTFFGALWTAHSGTTFGPGTYTIDTVQGGVYTGIVVGAGQIGGHILFNWGATQDIDVINVWDVTNNGVTITYTSSDATVSGPAIYPDATAFTAPDGIRGVGMIDGAFPKFHANFDFSIGIPPPLPLICKDVFVSTNSDVAIGLDIKTQLLDPCKDAQGPLTLLSYTQPSNGVVTDDGTTLTYTPDPGTGGLDNFTFTVDDATAVSQNTSKIEVQVGGELQGNFTMLDSNGDVFGGTNDVVFTWDGTSFNTNEADTNFSLIGIKSDKPQEFFSFVWQAHHVRVYQGPATLTFDTTCTTAQLEQGMGGPGNECNGPFSNGQTQQFLTMTIGAGQVGAHILFDWSTSTNIDVVNVWNKNAQWDTLGQTGNRNKLFLGPAGVTPAEDATWALVSTDVNDDSINGSPMVDGPFIDFYANFNNKPDKSGVPLPPIAQTQRDTKLDSSIFAMNIEALFASLMMLVGLRQVSRKK